jgi:hypothetical protein
MNDDKADPVQQLTAIPWYQSKVLQGIIVSGASQIVASLQSHGIIKIAPDIDFWVELTFQAIAIIAAAYAFYARTNKPTPPVSMSQSSATATNAANPNLPEKPNAS